MADAALPGIRVLAFAGIARPSKFHDTLRDAGAIIAGHVDFPDHHRFTDKELDRVLDYAQRLGAAPVTTPKDAVRLTPAVRGRVRVVGVGLRWDDVGALDAMLKDIVR
ncbi:MAG: tetraacyldisaccharide 4'-kinase [Gemmatimonadaceae bacterium]|nr:tetraacyldisaccharide 4'-kinase [Acetobacteraceae bacterium]